MRKSALCFLLLNVAVIAFLVNSVWTLLSLLVVDGSEDAISRAELPAANSAMIETRPQLIPKMIHQTYINESIPEVWQQAQQSCIDLHGDYEYKVGPDGTTAVSTGMETDLVCSYGQTRRRASSSRRSKSDKRHFRSLSVSAKTTQISLVPRNLRRLRVPYPARRRDPLLRPRSLRRYLHRPRRCESLDPFSPIHL